MAPKWTTYGKMSGWVEWGARPVKELGGKDYWSKATRVCCAAEGGKIDMVQCYDGGIMTAGPLGATAKFGYLQLLLGKALEHGGTKFIDHMHRAMYPMEGTISFVVRVPGLDERYVMRSAYRPEADATSDMALRDIFLAGSDSITWSLEQKAVALRWVECLTNLLRDHDFDPVVLKVSEKMLRGFAGGLPNFMSQPVELSIAFLAFAINHPAGAKRLINDANFDLDAMLRMAKLRSDRWPTTFIVRAPKIEKALAAG